MEYVVELTAGAEAVWSDKHVADVVVHDDGRLVLTETDGSATDFERGEYVRWFLRSAS